jgi:hypothetical protein
VSPHFVRGGRLEVKFPETRSTERTRCPFCAETFPPTPPRAPVAEIGKDYRDHLAAAHPVQLHDLKTTRWHDGSFVRDEPRQSKPRNLRSRMQPRGNHGLLRLEGIGGGPPESDDEWVTVTCKCGWTGLSVRGTKLAWHELRIHFRNDYRLACPHCGWYWEGQDREEAERTIAEHIGTSHPDRFPWGYA